MGATFMKFGRAPATTRTRIDLSAVRLNPQNHGRATKSPPCNTTHFPNKAAHPATDQVRGTIPARLDAAFTRPGDRLQPERAALLRRLRLPIPRLPAQPDDLPPPRHTPHDVAGVDDQAG